MSEPLVIEQHVAADPAEVYADWLSAEALAAWWWPQIPDTTYEIDAREGGHYEFRSAARGFGVRGRFVRLDQPRSIHMTWCWLDGDASAPEEQVNIQFRSDGDDTLVTVTHHLAEGADRESLREGWQAVVSRLAGRYVPR